jgi:hypothetical protein
VPDGAARQSYDDIGLHCDDGLDCPLGQTCCRAFGYRKRVCVARADVLPSCAAEICFKDSARCPPGRMALPWMGVH